MKSFLIGAALLTGSQVVAAEINSSIQNGEVIVFDARCTQVSAESGLLSVDLQMTKDKLFVRGTFAGNTSIDNCQKIKAELIQQVGRTIAVDGTLQETPYEATVEVWGKCKENPHVGGLTYPCKTGYQKITKYERTTNLDFGGVQVTNKSK